MQNKRFRAFFLHETFLYISSLIFSIGFVLNIAAIISTANIVAIKPHIHQQEGTFCNTIVISSFDNGIPILTITLATIDNMSDHIQINLNTVRAYQSQKFLNLNIRLISIGNIMPPTPITI